jgi:hypothetical protein
VRCCAVLDLCFGFLGFSSICSARKWKGMGIEIVFKLRVNGQLQAATVIRTRQLRGLFVSVMISGRFSDISSGSVIDWKGIISFF